MAITYEPIATANGTGSSGTITFSSIPSTYTDLVLSASYSGSTGAGFNFTLNNNTTNTSYSRVAVTISPPSTLGYIYSAQNSIALNYNGSFATTPEYSTLTLHFLNYSNTNVYKTILAKYGNTSTDIGPEVALWRGSTGSATDAINRIDLIASSGSWTTGSTFTLYGIKAA
jgi:hypothetical protein